MNYILDFVKQGGSIGYILVAMNFIGYAIIVWKIIALIVFNKTVQPRLTDKVVHRVITCDTDHHILTESVRTEIALAFSPLSKGLTTVQNIASISPMLGLLGTVVGIFNAFTVIASTGLDDPSAFATGIKFALVTTVLGLIVAIPHILAYNYLNAQMEQEQDEVENQVLIRLGMVLHERESKHGAVKENA